ncbi:MAG TPA: hypothetical protein VHL11_21680 [Phototrophicaceae bacterium]|jgi:hypothetical protein|nr:hypothetical protein [Phototrophicaceae bacterium]
MTLARDLSHTTLARIQSHFGMTEITRNGGTYQPLISPGPFGQVGDLRIFQGDQISKMVYIGMTVTPIGLDSHMIFAFTPPGSAVPHFTLDSVMNGADNFAFHLDLIPRVDLGANLEYLLQVLHPLSGTFEEVGKIEGLTPARLGPLQYAIMSPWMLAYRASASAFEAITAPVNTYLDHWFKLVDEGLGDLPYDADYLAERDRKNRAAIFNPEVDRVWAQVDRLLGVQTSTFLRTTLQDQAVIAPV